MNNKKLPTEKLSNYKNQESIKAALKKAKKQYPPQRIGYSIEEVDRRMKKYTEQSAERLRKRLRAV